jgi:hypothetical protein
METLNLIIGSSNIFSSIVIAALSIPLIRRSVKMNKFYGIRIKEALESDQNWYDINEFGGKKMFKWSIIICLSGFVSFFVDYNKYEYMIYLCSLIPVLIVIPCIQCTSYAKKLKR